MTETLERTTTEGAAVEERSPVQIRKLGHVVIRVRDVERSIRFYTEILNFRVSDVNEGGMVFFNTCGDHHTIAIAAAGAGEEAQHPAKDQLGLSHFAMEVANLDELFELREFLTLLSRTLSLPPPRSGPPFALAYPLALLRGGRGASPLPEEILRRARSTLFDVQKAIAELDFRASVSVDEGMKRLAAWVDECGGADGVLARARPLPDDAALEREASGAGA